MPRQRRGRKSIAQDPKFDCGHPDATDFEHGRICHRTKCRKKLAHWKELHCRVARPVADLPKDRDFSRQGEILLQRYCSSCLRGDAKEEAATKEAMLAFVYDNIRVSAIVALLYRIRETLSRGTPKTTPLHDRALAFREELRRINLNACHLHNLRFVSGDWDWAIGGDEWHIGYAEGQGIWPPMLEDSGP